MLSRMACVTLAALALTWCAPAAGEEWSRAYGYAMANNYNGAPRPPVIFARDGDAREVVRRESFEDLTARDVG